MTRNYQGFQFADADTEDAAKSIRSFSTQPDFYVITGKTPFERLHAYWQVAGISDIDEWKGAQLLDRTQKCQSN